MDNHAFHTDDNRRVQGELANQGNLRPFTVTRYQPRTDNNDYLVEVNSRAKIFKKPVFYKRLSVCFLLLAILFFILMIVFITLYYKPRHKICTTNECLKTASNYIYSMNFSVDPCDNFYEFACGRWSDEHPNHGWWSSFSSFTTISEKVAIASMNVLNVENTGTELAAIKKSRDFFKSCMDTDEMDELSVAVMYPILERMDIPVVPRIILGKTTSTKKFNWLRSDALVKNTLLMDVFIGATVGPNIFNGSRNVLYIGQLYQTSPLPSPAKQKLKNGHLEITNIMRRRSDKDEDAIKHLIKVVNSNIIKFVLNVVYFNNTGEDARNDLLENAANIIMDMSDAIDEIVTNTTNPDAQEDETHTISIKDLQDEVNSELTTSHKDFLFDYLSYLFNGTNVTINAKTDLLYVTDLDVVFLKIIMKYLSEIPEINIELYMWWATVYAMIINTSNEVSDYITKHLQLFATEPESVIRSRSLECALLTNNYLGYAVSYALADQSFLNVTKPKVERMVQGLKEAFVSHVNEISWMDRKTKKATLDKSKEMISFIGYPEWLFEKGELDKHYNDIVVKSNTFLDNMVNIITSHAKDNLKSLRKVHKRDWYSEPIEVNAFNSFSDNAINVPMAILNFPMYHLGLEVLNYGSIGSILGHELTHGFDNIGRKYDKYGNYVQWWTNQTVEAFENFTDCFIKQYDNYTLPGVSGHINGKRTLAENLADSGGLSQAFRAYRNYVAEHGVESKLAGFEEYSHTQLFFIAYANIDGKSSLGENLADNGGLNQAFSAYKSFISKYGEEPKLPGFENFSGYQLFFIAYASIWCESTNALDLEDQLKYDEHCPNSIRVIGTLQNSDDFAKEFHCPIDSPMNPKKKCKIW